MKVAHVITTLATGGAQTALFRLVTAPAQGDLRHSVVSLTDEGAFGPRLAAQGIPVSCLGMRPGLPDPRAVARLVRVLRQERPDVVQSWMYHANLLASVAATAARLPLVWNIRHADVDPGRAKRLTHLTNTLCARLSGFVPARVVCPAESAVRSHVALGYRASRMLVIPNGFDLDRLTRDPSAGAEVRRELGIPEKALVVGHLARFHPDKDHGTLLAAAHLVVAKRPDAAFVLAGDEVEWSNPALADTVDALGIRQHVRLLGVRRDVPALLSAFDLFASSSRTEAFPQVLGEAMSCQVPCVATDCGDSRLILGDTGVVVPCADPEAMAGAILDLMGLSPAQRAALGAAGRARVRERYASSAMLRRYASLYEEVASGHPRGEARR